MIFIISTQDFRFNCKANKINNLRLTRKDYFVSSLRSCRAGEGARVLAYTNHLIYYNSFYLKINAIIKMESGIKVTIIK
jgi:hypothetical protein